MQVIQVFNLKNNLRNIQVKIVGAKLMESEKGPSTMYVIEFYTLKNLPSSE